MLDGRVSSVPTPGRPVDAPGHVAVVFGPDVAALSGDGVELCGSPGQVRDRVAGLEAERHPRWTWWAAGGDGRALVAHGIRPQRCWDVAEAHRVLAGGWAAGADRAWAVAAGLDVEALPRPAGGDLFDLVTADDAGDPDSAVRPDGYLRPEALEPGWLTCPERALSLARAALQTSSRQRELLAQGGPRAVGSATSESAAALLCVELELDGLPLDRARAEELITAAAGERPRSEEHARQLRRERDAAVLAHAPGRESTDLRNPVQVRELLASVGVVVPDTRAWRLEPYRGVHPLVDALLAWRKAERIATTYGWTWLDTHVGPDDRLRGGWTACDGAAGRMTAQNGLHNLPTPLRPAVAAHPGHVLVRADLGQIEPRVLAAVSGDRAFAEATRAADLYAPVAQALGVERAVAKVAVLAAMYGQTSGAAGEALKDLQRAYPVAMAYLERAYAEGLAGRAVRTFGGRRVPMWQLPPDLPASAVGAATAARGRFARNAVIQGAAAELFKAWVATLRLAVRDLGAEVVLCLHDEVLLHVPQEEAGQVAHLVDEVLTASARRWTGSSAVQFVADTSVIARWSDAKA
ncbi:DNA polymerase-1 [Oryzihumus leptocrescens]|uniref:DNA-directed DNA polymerase n=1 Tax=Oryzihumus leptocrescens TaxID=297536 RepID=A0A542ZKL7_9MICO|nr:DNA polymerase-1 [Oryzihumus leptocrescens]